MIFYRRLFVGLNYKVKVKNSKTSKRIYWAVCFAIVFSGNAQAQDKQQFNVRLPSSDPPLNGQVASFGKNGADFKLGARRSFVPSMIKTPSQTGSVSADIVNPEVYKGWLQSTHPKFALSVNQYAPDAVIVVKGQWDNSTKTLKKLEIPHRRVSAREFNSLDLDKTRVVVVDCEGKLNQLGKQKLRSFVSRGGYLLSCDWDLDGFISSTFLNYIVWNKGVNRGLVYDATVVDADPVLFKNTVTDAPWKMDSESHLIRILNKSKVRLLVQSRKLMSEDPDKLGALAVVFPFGRGYVLHMAGHFDNNSGVPIRHRLPDPAPVIKISLRQVLATNFIVAGLTGERIPVR